VSIFYLSDDAMNRSRSFFLLFLFFSILYLLLENIPASHCHRRFFFSLPHTPRTRRKSKELKAILSG
jgi:hypothetical protein